MVQMLRGLSLWCPRARFATHMPRPIFCRLGQFSHNAGPRCASSTMLAVDVGTAGSSSFPFYPAVWRNPQRFLFFPCLGRRRPGSFPSRTAGRREVARSMSSLMCEFPFPDPNSTHFLISCANLQREFKRPRCRSLTRSAHEEPTDAA